MSRGVPGRSSTPRLSPTASSSPERRQVEAEAAAARMDGEDYPQCGQEAAGVGSGLGQGTPAAANAANATVVFQQHKEHLAETFAAMHALYESGQLSDVALLAEGERLPCHKIVLASASPYFRAMFTGGLREAAMSEVRLHGVKACVLRQLLSFIYTGEVRLTASNVCDLLPAATMLQLRCVTQACCQFLLSQLHPTNCIGIHQFAVTHGAAELARDADRFIERHFCELAAHDEFLELPGHALARVLGCDRLHVRTEADVFSALVRWVHHDRPARSPLLPDLLPLVRCHALAPDFIDRQLRACALLREQPGAREHLAAAHASLLSHRRVDANRRQSPLNSVIYAAGGYYRYSLRTFECLSLDSMRWERLPDLANPRSGLAAVSVRGCVYLVGGRNNHESGNADAACLDVFDPSACGPPRWHRCAPMSVSRNRVAVGIIDDKIYAIGGASQSQSHCSGERYDPDSDQWLPIAPMRQARIGLGAAVVDRLLYAVGGFDGCQRLSSVERYWPEDDRWEPVAPMTQPRSGAGVVAVGKYIYAIGGYDSQQQLRTVERLDTEANQWLPCAPMLRPRSALAAVAVSGSVWVFGGYDGYEFVASVEVYCPRTDAWTEREPMSCGKSGHGVCVGVSPSSA